MGIGVGVILLVVGAIIAFALDFNISGIEEYVLGWILILGGLLAIAARHGIQNFPVLRM